MTRDFNKQQRDDERPSFRNKPSNKYGEERSPRPARPRLNRETVDRAWESGAQTQHHDYRPRSTNGQPTRNGQPTNRYSEYSSRDNSNGNRPPYGNRSESSRPPYGNRSEGRPPYGNRSEGNRPPYGNRSEGRPPYGNRSEGGSRPPYGNRSEGRPPYGNRSEGGSRPPYGNHYEDNRPPYGNRSEGGSRPPYGNRSEGSRPPYGNRSEGGSRPPYGNRSEGRPPYGNRSEDSRPPYGNRREYDRGGNPGGRPYTNQGSPNYRNTDADEPRHQPSNRFNGQPSERRDSNFRGNDRNSRFDNGRGQDFKRDEQRPLREDQRNIAREEQRDSSPRGRGRYEGDYEGLEEKQTPRQEPYFRNTKPRRGAEEPAEEKHVTRLPDGRVLKGPRPVQRKNEQFWNGINGETENLVNQVHVVDNQDEVEAEKQLLTTLEKLATESSENVTTAPESSAEVAAPVDTTEAPVAPEVAAKPVRKPRTRSTANSESKESSAEKKPRVTALKPSQRGFKWPTP